MSLLSSVVNKFTHVTPLGEVPHEYSKLRTKDISHLKEAIVDIHKKYGRKDLLVFKQSSSVPKWCAMTFDAIEQNASNKAELLENMNTFIHSYEQDLQNAKRHMTEFIVFVIQKLNSANHEAHLHFSGELSVQSRNDLIFQIPHSFHEEGVYQVRREYPDPNDNKNSPIKYIPQKYVSVFDVVYSTPAFEIAQLESNIRAIKRLYAHFSLNSNL